MPALCFCFCAAARRRTIARAAVRYDEVARALVLPFKYGDRLNLMSMMGLWTAREFTKDALVPVPVHWPRLWWRRFNQSAALAGNLDLVRHAGALRHAQARARDAATSGVVEAAAP